MFMYTAKLRFFERPFYALSDNFMSVYLPV